MLIVQPEAAAAANTAIDTAVEVPDQKAGCYDAVRFNAMKHGILSRYVVLSHENADEYTDLLGALVSEHRPAGATEAHLVEELAAIIWRKRRVMQAEAANINHGLRSAARNSESVIPAAVPFESGLSGKGSDLCDVLTMAPEDVLGRIRDTRHDLDATRKAAGILRGGGGNAYEKAQRALLPDSREWWEQCVEDEQYPATSEGLAEFIRDELEPLCIGLEKEAKHHDAIKAQALGEGLQVYRLEKIGRYETHLDRKFERTLGMLVKLKGLRGGR